MFNLGWLFFNLDWTWVSYQLDHPFQIASLYKTNNFFPNIHTSNNILLVLDIMYVYIWEKTIWIAYLPYEAFFCLYSICLRYPHQWASRFKNGLFYSNIVH